MKKILLIDGSSLLFRAFYAIKNLKTKDGVFVNGVYGFLNMYYKALELIEPTHIFVAFDKGSNTFRHKDYSEYKATRTKAPEEIQYQFGILKDLLDSMNIKYLDMDNFEADDILGTVAKKAMKEGFEVCIFTGDRDYLQLVDDNITVYLTKKGITDIKVMTKEAVKEEFSLSPIKLIDVKALQGDTSDNIPGVKGIGEKNALKLIRDFGSLDGVYDNLDKLKGKLKENLEEEKDKAYLSYKLGEIYLNVPIQYQISDFKIRDIDYDKFIDKLQNLEFKSIIKKLPKRKEEQEDTFKEKKDTTKEKIDFEIVELKDVFEKIQQDEISIKFFSDENYIYRENFYIGIYSKKNNKVYISQNKDLEQINKIFNLNIKKIGYDIKEEIYYLFKNKKDIEDNYEDCMILEYLLDSNKGSYQIEKAALEYLNFNMINLNDLKGKGKNKKTFFELKKEDIFNYICEFVFITFKLFEILEKKCFENNLLNLYQTVEKPLIKVMADMESVGVLIDKDKLLQLREIYQKKSLEYEERIYEISSEKFNLNSPKQLGEILFKKLKLPVIKKTKTGYSTDVEVLEKLRENYEIADYILEYRALNKLISTYIDGILSYITKDGRIHTSFKQTVTATGRLSSVDPNLQNIPVRTQEGKNIRKAFIAAVGNTLVDADYSQIELRVLAHLSNDKVMIDSFKNDLDIHKKTASEVFKVPINEVTEQMRQCAKAVNFGIVYGISDYGLSKDLNISRKEAKEYINGYLNTYPQIQKYMEDIIEKAKEDGFVTTILNRKRQVKEIQSKNFNIRSFGERIALNTPIQGSAADIIKLAMIKVYNELKTEKLDAKLILQIHDELIVECDKKDSEKVKEILKNSMENVYKLNLPLKVDICKGENWYEAK